MNAKQDEVEMKSYTFTISVEILTALKRDGDHFLDKDGRTVRLYLTAEVAEEEDVPCHAVGIEVLDYPVYELEEAP